MRTTDTELDRNKKEEGRDQGNGERDRRAEAIYWLNSSWPMRLKREREEGRLDLFMEIACASQSECESQSESSI